VKSGKIIVLVLFAALIGAFFAFGGTQYLSFDYIKSQQAAFQAYYQANQAKTIAIYFVAYVVITALSLPAAAVITLLGGAIFGVVVGSVVVSFASSLGATVAFLAARFVLRDSIESKFGSWLKGINEGLERDGPFYLFTIRMIPAVPFFVVNLVFGLTKIKTWTFYWVSQVGMFLGTVVFVNAGTQLAKLDSAKGIFSPSIIGAFVFLAVLPMITKWIIGLIKARKVYAKWNHLKPKSFDHNMVVIGAGSAGLVTALIAGAVKAKVMLIEKHRRGGDCLNTGCVPSKALIRSAKFVSHVQRAQEFGMSEASTKVDFRAVMERVQRIIKTIEPHDSAERFETLGVSNMAGSAKITSPWHVEVTEESGKKTVLTTKSIVIAAGARPFVPPIPGLVEAGCLTSDNLWELREQPKRLVVLGGGPIGSEMTQAFARLGTQVTQVEMAPRIMIREDEEVSQFVMARFKAEGIDVRVNHKAKQVVVENGDKFLICEADGKDVKIGFDAILCAVGRVANTTGYGLEELGIPTSKTRTVEANEYLQTMYPNILAAGDVVGPYQFTHTAAHQAWYAAVNGLFGRFKKFKADYSVIPWATFTEPEVARVGLNEQEAKQQGIAYQMVRYELDHQDRALADGEAHGWVKVLVAPGDKKGKILGATIVGEHAGDLLAEFVFAKKWGLGLNHILGTIHTYPTLSEGAKGAAGNWKRANAPQGALKWLQKYHAWERA
jgi:pyruvate/2-oxoglutarate dehydrogenase complex dihydrolipoamide dehydrogenase (E3) component/uncharacterized membrane protein YdjX (TVP38/TMEM64 family)